MQLVFIVGLYKSGTSIITKLIENMGFPNFDDLWEDTVEGVNNNYLTQESESVNKLNDKIIKRYYSTLYRLPPFWLYRIRNRIFLRKKIFADQIHNMIISQKSNKLVIKDPRFCITLPLWLSALDSKFSIKVVFVVRNRDNIVKSWLKDQWSVKSLKLNSKNQACMRCKEYEKYFLQQYIDNSVGFDCHLVDFETLKKDTDIQIRSLMNFVEYEGDITKLTILVRK